MASRALVCTRWLSSVAVLMWCLPLAAAGITRSGDVAADVEQLQSLSRAQWLALTIADLGEAWWIVHEAGAEYPERYAGLSIAVRVNGKVGYINTRRLDVNGTGDNRSVPADLFQSFSGGNYSILVSGASPPRRPANPLAWRGFVWEGLEAPATRIGDVFDDVALMPRNQIAFASSGPLRSGLDGVRQDSPSASKPASSASAGTARVDAESPSPTAAIREPVTRAPTPPGREIVNAATTQAVRLPVRPAPRQATRESEKPASTPAIRESAKPASTTTKPEAANSTPSVSSVPPLPPLPPVPAHIPRRIEGEAGAGRAARLPAQLERDARTRHISRINQTLRRRVAYLEALLLGPDLGRDVDLDASVSDLLEIIMNGEDVPQRNVFLRLGTGVESKVGRIVNAKRYPLYNVVSAGRGSHTILLDIEIRGPDGRTLLKSSAPDSKPDSGADAGPLQFRQVHENMSLRELGITSAVWWPIPEHLKRRSQR